MSDPDADPPKSRLLKELYFNRTGLVLVLTALLAVGMYVLAAHTHGNASVFWLTLATGILATAVYTACTVFLTTKQFNSFLSVAIDRSVNKAVLAAIGKQDGIYLPRVTYPAALFPGKAFNEDLNKSFCRSRQYIFQGITARYNIARLAFFDTTFEVVRIIIADPSQPDSAVTRVLDRRFGDSEVSETDLARVLADLIDDIWMSVVGAYQCWRKADRIEICFLADPPLDRVEIFDEDMFLSCFSDQAPRRFEFPRSYRFLSTSLLYRMQLKESAKHFTSKYAVRVQIPRDDDPRSLLLALSEAGLQLSESQYERYRAEFWEHVRKLPREMKH